MTKTKISSEHSITFGKDRYHQILEMEEWCHDYIGEGGWTYGMPKAWEGMGKKEWVIYSMFGTTTFGFKKQSDLTFFMLRWA